METDVIYVCDPGVIFADGAVTLAWPVDVGFHVTPDQPLIIEPLVAGVRVEADSPGST